ncbi:hypothetical protein [Thiothrix unzii]|uniref:Uncharacterized protein n=1 Tax=Thiothrix unzii TaxID=111769 RepID=A0A975IIW7_9GAMM|nr:hypothetical protein [Thiothrix unzii]QTR55417.1 hypothetical protein J9260_18035 [Thiothrix unzii]
MNTQPLILDIGHIQRRIHAVQLDIARYGVTLRLADFATLLMLFVFLVGFYVADPFHIASFIAQRFGANSTVELAVYALLLVMAGLMAVTIARLKRAHYEHKAKYRFSGSVWKVGIVIMAFTVFAEIYNATGNQQHSQFAKAESSKAFAALSNQKLGIGGSTAADNTPLVQLQGELAKHREYLATCKKTCYAQRVRIAELTAEIHAMEAGQAAADAQAQQANATAANALATQLRQLKEDYLHPMVKALMAVGIPASIAMQLIAALVAIAFERMHLSASENLRDCYSLLDGLEQHLLNKRKEYASLTGVDYLSANTNNADNPADNAPENWQLAPALSPTTATNSASAPPLFKWQQPHRPIGFVDTNQRTAPACNTHDAHPAEPLHERVLHARVATHTTAHTHATAAKAGEEVECPQCGTRFRKVNKWHTFCKTACKDAWHNAQHPERAGYVKTRKRKA